MGHETWTNDAGTVRATYRTAMTAADEFSRSFLTESVQDGRAGIGAESLARWCLEQFCLTVEFMRDGAWSPPVRFTWAMFDAMKAEDVADGWPQTLALAIWSNTVKRQAENLDALKKTSVKPLGNST